MHITKHHLYRDIVTFLYFSLDVPLDGPALPVGVNDATTFVQEGTENKERTITNNRDKDKVRDMDKVKVWDQDNVLMSAVAGQMEGDARYVPIFFEALFYISQKIPSDQRTIRNIWMHHPLQRSRISLLQLPKVRQFANFLNFLQLNLFA